MTRVRFDPNDRQFMRRALTLARKGQGRVEPNPMVGCVFAKSGRIIGEGFHKRFGGPHAEIEALKSLHGPAPGATIYVTLEPCDHHGKTPPCTDAVIQAIPNRVVIAMRDPAEHASGKGIRKLKSAGIEVDVGCLARESQLLNAPYLTLLRMKRPYVILKWAQSLDGCLSTPPGQPPTISGPQAQRRVHQWRARVDAVIVGVDTIKSDDPKLTARIVRPRRIATRIVMDSRLRVPADAHIVRTAKQTPTCVFTTTNALRRRPRAAQRLERVGVNIVPCRSHADRIDLGDAFFKMGAMKMTNVLIEAGPTLIAALLEQRIPDEIAVFVAPLFVHRPSPDLLAACATQRFVVADARRVGNDMQYRLSSARCAVDRKGTRPVLDLNRR